jgi:hypothetical protein
MPTNPNPYLTEVGYGETMGDDDLGYGETMGASDMLDVVGDDDIGAMRAAAVRQIPQRKRMMAARARQQYTPQQKVEILRGDDVMFGVDTGATLIAAGVSATITTAPQKRNMPSKLFLSAGVAANFVINDIRVGVDPVLATTGAISAAVFVQDSNAPPFRSVICEVGMDFSMTVTNISAAAARFTATVQGKYVPANL